MNTKTLYWMPKGGTPMECKILSDPQYAPCLPGLVEIELTGKDATLIVYEMHLYAVEETIDAEVLKYEHAS